MPRLSELKIQCQALGLSVSGEAKAPYERALREHFLQRDYPSGLPYQELFPMQCFTYWDLSPREQKYLWKDTNDWIAQTKINGCRLILHFIKDVGVFAHSRQVNISTYRRHDLTEYLIFRDFKPPFTATIDSEVLKGSLQETSALLHMRPDAARESQQGKPLTIYPFDITFWQGTDLRRKKLAERLGYMDELRSAVEKARLQNFEFLSVVVKDKEEFFERVVSNGGEGVILKSLNSRYHDNSSRDRHAWVKVKRQLELDSYVSGFEPGRVGTRWESKVAVLLFSVATEAKPKLIAKVSNIPWQFRKEISRYDQSTGKVSLKPEVYGRVAHILGQEFSHRAFRLTHPRISYWRSDLRQSDCLYNQTDLEALRAGAFISPLRKV